MRDGRLGDMMIMYERLEVQKGSGRFPVLCWVDGVGGTDSHWVCRPMQSSERHESSWPEIGKEEDSESSSTVVRSSGLL